MGKFGKVENRHRISMNVNTLPFAIPASNLAQLVFGTVVHSRGVRDISLTGEMSRTPSE